MGRDYNGRHEKVARIPVNYSGGHYHIITCFCALFRHGAGRAGGFRRRGLGQGTHPLESRIADHAILLCPGIREPIY